MFFNKLRESKDIIISSHVNPDGDSIGTGLALYWAIKNQYPEKNIRYIIEDNVPYNYKFLKGAEKIEKYANLKDEPKADIFIVVDSANFKRIGRVGEFKKNAFLVNIDHHISNSNFGDYNFVKQSSSASEVLYEIITNILKLNIDKIVAECLYVGIITDSGNFQYESVTKETFNIASKLIEKGIDKNKIINCIYKSRTLGYMKVLGLALSKMRIIKEKKMVYFTLSRDFIVKENIQKDETDGIVEKMLEYIGCEVALFLKEEENGKIKGSLRSKERIDVNNVAKIFDGGGHKRAAGFTTDLMEKDIIISIIERI